MMEEVKKGKRRARRWIVLGTLIAAVAAVVASTAFAAVTTKITIKASISPKKVGTPRHPVPITLTTEVDMTNDPAAKQPPTLDKAIVFFPKDAIQNGNLFPSCSAKILNGPGDNRCPKGSKIGSGFANGTIQFGTINERVSITMFNGAKGKLVLFHVQGFNPLLINQTVEAKLQKLHGGNYGYKLTFPLPHNLQEVGPGQFAGVNKFFVKVGATIKSHGKKRGYLETIGCPKNTTIQGTFSFISDGVNPVSDPTSASTRVACKK
jgi:hypothetical protein